MDRIPGKAEEGSDGPTVQPNFVQPDLPKFPPLPSEKFAWSGCFNVNSSLPRRASHRRPTPRLRVARGAERAQRASVVRPRDRFHTVCCPSCLQAFEVAGPSPAECPTEWDYDCEVCCRPMVIVFTTDGDEVWAEARGINE